MTDFDDTDASKYLDYSAYIRSLEQAEEAHNLDNQGCIEQLTIAAKACESTADRHSRRATEFMLAKCHYLSEIRRRTSVKPGSGPRDNKGHSLPSPTSFTSWCKTNQIPLTYASQLATIGGSTNPSLALEEHRKYRNYYQRSFQDKRRDLLETAKLVTTKTVRGRRDPLSIIKREWYRLSPVQRSAFMEWVYQQTPTDKEAAD